MRIDDLMTKNVSCCSRTDRLNRVSHIMWHEDCGVVPVLDSARRVVGVITDRDVCMAAYTTGRALRELAVEDAMSRDAHCCKQTDAIEAVHRLIRKLQVRRLPVVDEERRLVGLVSLCDLVRAVDVAGSGSGKEAEEFATTFAAATRPRQSDKTNRSAAPPVHVPSTKSTDGPRIKATK